jgi:hypothetical protein
MRSVDCKLHDISTRGARIVLPEGWSPPDQFKIVSDSRGSVMQARRVWQTGDNIGVSFEATRMEPPTSSSFSSSQTANQLRKSVTAIDQANQWLDILSLTIKGDAAKADAAPVKPHTVRGWIPAFAHRLAGTGNRRKSRDGTRLSGEAAGVPLRVFRVSLMIAFVALAFYAANTRLY